MTKVGYAWLIANSIHSHRLYRNNGKLARKRREGEFAELTNQEIAEIEAAYRSAIK